MRSAVDSPSAVVGSAPEVALGPGREFSLIGQAWRSSRARPRVGSVVLGIGDDAALLSPDPSLELAVAVDTLVEGRHYWPHADPQALGRKLLAVNLSDLAAMGADPFACTLSLCLRPESTGQWLTHFSQGLQSAAAEWGCPLVGGDTVGLAAGAAQVLTLQVLGGVPRGHALRRDGMQPGDDLWVSGCLGDPAEAVLTQTDHPKLHAPEPRLALGRFLRGRAHAAIDLSDGMVSELSHLMTASEARLGRPLGLTVALDALSACLGERLTAHLQEGRLSRLDCCRRAAEGGDEYELVFSAPTQVRAELEAWSQASGLRLTRIGEVGTVETGARSGLHWLFQSVPCAPDQRPRAGFDHFRENQE